MVLLRVRPWVGAAGDKLLAVTATYRHAGNLEAAGEPSRGMRTVAQASYLIGSRCGRKGPGNGLVNVKLGRRG